MTLDQAIRIRERKLYCTYRALAEWFYPIDDPLFGNQLAGQELCREACKLLGIDWMKDYKIGEDPEFDRQNQSRFGHGAFGPTDYYWWE